MSARVKLAPLVWEPSHKGPGDIFATFDGWEAHVWHVGGEYPFRSQIGGSLFMGERFRVVAHFTIEGAKASAEKRLRKAGA